MADKIAAISRSTHSNSTLTANTLTPSAHITEDSVSNSFSSDDRIVSALEKLGDRISRLESSKFQEKRPFKRSTPRDKSNERKGLICHFHYKFKNQARNCALGCSWKNKTNDCQEINICIFHDLFQGNARKCISGCKFFSKFASQDSSSSKN